MLPLEQFSRPRKTEPTTIVVHCTAGGTFQSAFETLKKRGLSYHYIIDKDGTVHKLVPYNRVAFHAGKSKGPDGGNVNEYSIGVSFVNRNDGRDPYLGPQIKAFEVLCSALKRAVPTLKWMVGHVDVSLSGKTDPRNFPTKDFAEKLGFEFWTKEGG